MLLEIQISISNLLWEVTGDARVTSFVKWYHLQKCIVLTIKDVLQSYSIMDRAAMVSDIVLIYRC